jgi:hypothetical protein
MAMVLDLDDPAPSRLPYGNPTLPLDRKLQFRPPSRPVNILGREMLVQVKGESKRCMRCQKVFYICLKCERGHWHCSQGCSYAARSESLRTAKRKYRLTDKGRAANRKHQALFRKNQRLKNIVRDQSPEIEIDRVPTSPEMPEVTKELGSSTTPIKEDPKFANEPEGLSQNFEFQTKCCVCGTKITCFPRRDDFRLRKRS